MRSAAAGGVAARNGSCRRAEERDGERPETRGSWACALRGRLGEKAAASRVSDSLGRTAGDCGREPWSEPEADELVEE